MGMGLCEMTLNAFSDGHRLQYNVLLILKLEQKELNRIRSFTCTFFLVQVFLHCLFRLVYFLLKLQHCFVLGSFISSYFAYFLFPFHCLLLSLIFFLKFCCVVIYWMILLLSYYTLLSLLAVLRYLYGCRGQFLWPF